MKSTQTSMYFKDLSFSPLSNRLLQKKTLLKLKCLIVWGVNVQYLAFVWLTQDFIGCLRHSSLFHTKGSFSAKLRKNFGCYWCYFCTLNLFPSPFPPPTFFFSQPFFLCSFTTSLYSTCNNDNITIIAKQ